MIYNYTDGYLMPDDERELRALADINKIGITDAFYLEKLVILKTYLIVCLEDQSAPDDLFNQKLKHYQSEYDKVLQEALANKNAAIGAGVWYVPLGRG